MKNSGANIIAIASSKGGVGKTTTLLNLAGIISKMQKKVLIIDLDLFSGDIALWLNKESNKNVYNFVDNYNNNRFKDYLEYVTKYNEYIDYIAAPKDPRNANKIESKYIELLFNKYKSHYDTILVDTSHVLNEFNITILDKVDKILFLVTPEAMSLNSMRSLLSIFKDIDLDKYKVILNNSINPDRNYFSNYDIKNILKNNIDYTLSSKFYMPNIDEYIMEGKIITLDEKLKKYLPKDYKALNGIVNYILESVDINEEE